MYTEWSGTYSKSLVFISCTSLQHVTIEMHLHIPVADDVAMTVCKKVEIVIYSAKFGQDDHDQRGSVCNKQCHCMQPNNSILCIS
jgi:hypothetical protein